jgi:predicted alpha/beta hydrolase
LVFIRPPSAGPNEDADLNAFYQALEQVFARRRPHVVVYDVRGVKMSPHRSDRMNEWTTHNDGAIRAHMIALAVLVSSEHERAQVTAGFWSLKQSFHARIFDDAHEAERWLLSEFARGEGAN